MFHTGGKVQVDQFCIKTSQSTVSLKFNVLFRDKETGSPSLFPGKILETLEVIKIKT